MGKKKARRRIEKSIEELLPTPSGTIGPDIVKMVELRDALMKTTRLTKLQERFAFAQTFNESAGLHKKEAIAEKNVGGITYQSTLRNAVPSQFYKDPSSNPYAKYANWEDFWYGFLYNARVTKAVGENKEGPPISAVTVKDYVHRLWLNGYFKAEESAYLGGVERYFRESTTILAYLDSMAEAAINEHKFDLPRSTGNALNDLVDMFAKIEPPQVSVPLSTDEDIYMPPNSLKNPSLKDLPIGVSKIAEMSAKRHPSGYGNIYQFVIKTRRANGDIVTDIHETMDPQPRIETPKPATRAVKNKPASSKGSLSDVIPWSLRPRPYQYQKNKFFKLDSFSNPFSLPTGAPKSEHIEGTKGRARRNDTAYKTPATSAANDLFGVTSDSEGNNPDFFMRSFLKPQTDFATGIGTDGDTRRIVSVNINTPLIGSLTIAATGMGETVYNIQRQVEQTLLEVLNNVNTA